MINLSKKLIKQNLKSFEKPTDLLYFVKYENPHQGITEEEKIEINRIGTSLNNAIRKGYKLDPYTQNQKDLFQRLINRSVLKQSIVVHRAVESIEYELKLASEKGLSNRHLYHDGFVYTSLLESYKNRIHLNIVIPAGTHYLYTGTFSNVCGVYPSLNGSINDDMVGELILDIGTILKIDKKSRKGKLTIYDTHVVHDAESYLKTGQMYRS